MNNIIECCEKKWGICKSKDKRIEHFEQTIEGFLNRFKINDDRYLIEELIKEFDYYDEVTIRKQLDNKYKELTNKYKVDLNDTIFLTIKKEFDSSTIYLALFLFDNYDLKKMYRLGGIVSYTDTEWKQIKNIIIFDDICGSGDTIDTFLKVNEKKLNQKTLYYVVIHIMKDAEKKVTKIKNKYHNIDIKLIYYKVTDKAFKNKEENKEKFKTISNNFGYIEDKEVFGYKNSQSLVAFYNNSPNNTLGIFINKKENDIEPLFPRIYHKTPKYESYKVDRIKRKNERYESGKKYD